jgi:hypothetical protein
MELSLFLEHFALAGRTEYGPLHNRLSDLADAPYSPASIDAFYPLHIQQVATLHGFGSPSLIHEIVILRVKEKQQPPIAPPRTSLTKATPSEVPLKLDQSCSTTRLAFFRVFDTPGTATPAD